MEDHLGSPFQQPCLSPSQAYFLGNLLHAFKQLILVQYLNWDDTCLRIKKASHVACVKPQVKSTHLFLGKRKYSKTQERAIVEISQACTCPKKQLSKTKQEEHGKYPHFTRQKIHRWSLWEICCFQLPSDSSVGHISLPTNTCHFQCYWMLGHLFLHK